MLLLSLYLLAYARISPRMTHIDYLAIGHITRDLTPEGDKLGGTVSFSSRLAQALGCKTAVLTSSSLDFEWQHELPGIEIVSIPAAETTTFENIYTPNGRIQTLSGTRRSYFGATCTRSMAASQHRAFRANGRRDRSIHDPLV